jgi:hypothetical protein
MQALQEPAVCFSAPRFKVSQFSVSICILILHKQKRENVEDKNYIAGIYNYCDRWCEKCTFTVNCMLFTKESRIITKELLKNHELTDIKDAMFPLPPDEDEQEEHLEQAEEELYEEDDYYEDEDLPPHESELSRPMHLLEVLSDEYFDKTHTFLDELFEKYKLYRPLNERQDNPKINSIFNQFEVINWYHTFIGAKITRALMAKSDLINDDEDIKEFAMQDINGSAKVAAIGITKSIESLNRLYLILDSYHTVISELLILAGKILNHLDLEFPGYKDFIRPGLDKEK